VGVRDHETFARVSEQQYNQLYRDKTNVVFDDVLKVGIAPDHNVVLAQSLRENGYLNGNEIERMAQFLTQAGAQLRQKPKRRWAFWRKPDAEGAGARRA
jgi:hypothetical protein